MQNRTTQRPVTSWSRLGRNRTALFGLTVAVAMLLTGLFAPWLAPYSYSDQNLDLVEAPPSAGMPASRAASRAACAAAGVVLLM